MKSGRELLIYTAANSEKKECGRANNLTNTAAIEKRQSCGRVSRSFIRPQKGKRTNAAVRPTSPIRPQLKKDRAAAVFLAHWFEPPCRSGDSPTQISAYFCSFLNLLKGPSSLRHATGVSLRTFHFCPSIPVFC